MRKLSKIDAAYLAGLIDGEGCIGIYFNGQTFVGRLSIAMTVAAPLHWARKITGAGKITIHKPKNRRHNHCWRYILFSHQAGSLLKQLVPFLKVKRKQVENLLSFRVGIKKRYGSRGMPRLEKKRRIRHYKISRKLNSRGTRWI